MQLGKSPNSLALVLFASALTISGCGSTAGEPVARAGGRGIDRTTQALTSGELESVNGTYGGSCRNRTGAWSVEIQSMADLANDPLSVVLNNTACVLTLTELVTSTGGTLGASPTFALTAAYQATPSEFDSPLEFYANARLDSVSFANDFVLTVLYSDDSELATGDKVAMFEVVDATAVGTAVAAPDYTLSTALLDVRTDINDVVVGATGTVNLTAGLVTGQRYVVSTSTGLDTYEEIDDAYIAGTDAALVLAVPAADFTLMGVDLTSTAKRSLIIANIASGVNSYKVFEITFSPVP
jgi:hypothetical protein